ncbi:hypothetical protein ECSTEC94C_3005 [Escherichia coli STEC_94C]|nr:hypothetical protein ECSTEC94C_3005 [Escherichia coli STEC_94C]EHW38609.1 hypothetical protein ECDEC9B_3047 [Escherichia coli DEC9B]EHW61200.1 hypothetical protein ECDEC10A_3546 [Escherichia coli DEC10A]EHX87628.1 hypothetical protein ECDEC14C_2975 [Escherichia coli DEC14C]EIJ12156.1 hypothetical protein EC900105_1586 [Escherichia coli 900105 (10e)]
MDRTVKAHHFGKTKIMKIKTTAIRAINNKTGRAAPKSK